MRRPSIYLSAVFVLLLLPAMLLAQGQAPTGAPAAGGPPPGAGQRGAPVPANVAFHNERNDMRHQGFVDIAKKGNIDLLFVGDSITDWFYWPLRGGEATGGKVWEANFAPL